MADAGDPVHVTRLLHEWQQGSQQAFDLLVPLVYEELRVIAGRQLRREWRADRMEVTAVVHEAYLRLFDQREVDWQNRGHFFAIAAQLMRRILVDHARSRGRLKRGGDSPVVPLSSSLASTPDAVDAVDALDLDRALIRLEALDPLQAQVVELRFFGGLTIEEAAAAMACSPATVKREWALAKGWLYRELGGQDAT